MCQNHFTCSLICSLSNEWTDNVWYIHTMECYLAIKGNEVQIHATTWTNLENMLSDRSQTQETTYRISFKYNVQSRQIRVARKWISDHLGPQAGLGWGRARRMHYCYWKQGSFFGVVEVFQNSENTLNTIKLYTWIRWINYKYYGLYLSKAAFKKSSFLWFDNLHFYNFLRK